MRRVKIWFIGIICSFTFGFLYSMLDPRAAKTPVTLVVISLIGLVIGLVGGRLYTKK